MRLQKILDSLPMLVRGQIETYRLRYAGLPHMREDTRSRMAGYVLGLRDAGLITERSRMQLFVYMTVAPSKEAR